MKKLPSSHQTFRLYCYKTKTQVFALRFTCIGLQIFWGHHDNKTDCPFVAKHLIGPATDGAHALDGRNAIVGDEHLEKQDFMKRFLALCVALVVVAAQKVALF